MLIGSDEQLNLVQVLDESLQNVLTQTMINQDDLFRNQVLELHRLYQIQKILMKEMDLQFGDEFNFGEESPSSFGCRFPKQLKYELLATEKKFCEVPTTCSSTWVKNNYHRACLKREQSHINLELPASYHSNDCENFLYEKYGNITPAVSENDFDFDKASSVEELKLSLIINSNTWQKCSTMREDEVIFSPSQSYINLEASTKKASYSDFIAISDLGYSPYSEAKNNVSYWNSKMHLLTDVRPNFVEKKPVNQEVEQNNANYLGKIMPMRRKLFKSHEVVELDLNKTLPDESSLHSIEHGISSPLHCTLSGVTHGEIGKYGKGTCLAALDQEEQKINCSSDPSAFDQQDMMNSMLLTSSSRDTCEVICGSTQCSIDLSSICEPPANAKDPISCTLVNLPDTKCQAISVHEVSVKKSKEDMLHLECLSQVLVEGADSNGFPVSCKSDSIPRSISCKENTGHNCIDMEESNGWPRAFQASIVSKEQCHHDGVPSSDSKMKSQLSNQKKQKLTEADITVKDGAVSHLYFSWVTLARDQESNRRKESGNGGRDVPQYSSESYESIVLKQQESSVDRYSMTSTLFEGPGMNEKDYGKKLKRGRRMKNFQKEVLPGLASLSRQEICQDVRIMRGAIRSREYKKYRSKMTGISNCFSPVKSKRSR